MEKGTLVEFRQGSDTSGGARSHHRLGLLDRPEGKKHWIAVDDRGQNHTLHPRDITYVLPGNDYSLADLKSLQAELGSYLDPSTLEVAWEFLVEEKQPVGPAEMAELLFSDQSPVCCYAAYLLLAEDKLYFKQRKDQFEPRSSAQVAELKHQIAVEQEKQTRWHSLIERMQQKLRGEAVAWEEGDRPYLEALEQFVLFPEETKQKSAALELLKALDQPTDSRATFELLVNLGHWQPHENLQLRRKQIPTLFSSKVLDVTYSRLSSPPPDPDAAHRLDLTHLKVYTIDDESTREIDDGLSVELLEEGRQRLWIHIADPTRWLQPGDELDLDARRRGTTVYLPEQTIPMFPKELATGPMSLVQGQVCCALSFSVILKETGEVEEFNIYPASIRPTYRLTYSDVDEMLELGVTEEAELAYLHAWAKRRLQWREAQGSVTIRMPEASIKVGEDGEIVIDVLEESPSRQLVAEMMILAGEIAGRYGHSHGLPVPFRQQSQPELPSEAELLALPAGPVRDCAVRRCMPRSEVNLTPGRHASLGLEFYTQVTSPIRRYSDLIAHFQIKAHLRGDPLPFERDALQQLLVSLGLITYEAVLVERQTKHYWALEYLRRKGDCPWPALMLRWLREHENLALVLLEDLGLELPTRFDRNVALGDRITLRVTHVDPREEVIRFQEVIDDAA